MKESDLIFAHNTKQFDEGEEIFTSIKYFIMEGKH